MTKDQTNVGERTNERKAKGGNETNKFDIFLQTRGNCFVFCFDEEDDICVRCCFFFSFLFLYNMSLLYVPGLYINYFWALNV